jgi:hypothetical protein
VLICWYFHHHLCSHRRAPLLRLRPNPASMRLDQRPGDSKSQSRGRAVRVGAGLVGAVEDVGQIGGRRSSQHLHAYASVGATKFTRICTVERKNKNQETGRLCSLLAVFRRVAIPQKKRWLPLHIRTGIDARGFPHVFVHGHVGERLTEDAVVDGPRAQADALGRFGLAEGMRVVEARE